MFKTILLSVDLTEASSWTTALPVAVEYCQAFGARLHLFTAVPDFGMAVVAQYFPENFEREALAEAGKKLEALAKDRVPDEIETHLVVGYGTVYDEIMKAAKAVDADLIVVAAHRPDLKDYLLGPNAARVVRHADCSVLVVRG